MRTIPRIEELEDAILATVKFWLDLGVDGYRLDTAPFYFHDQQLRDNLLSKYRFDNIIGAGAGQIPLGATILKATLQISTGVGSNAQTGGEYGVSQLLQAFNVGTQFADFGANGPTQADGELGAVASFFTGVVEGKEVVFDVKTILQAWANGASNFGFNIQSLGTSDGWQVFASGALSPELRPLLLVEFAPQQQGIPEPATAMSLLGALGLLGGRRRRRA